MLQVLDDGRLTDNKGRVVNFKNTIIIMTSNLGSHLIQENFNDLKEDDDIESIVDSTKRCGYGIAAADPASRISEPCGRSNHVPSTDAKRDQRDHPHPVGRPERTVAKQGLQLEFSNYALEYFSEQGFDPQFGARPLKRLIQKDIINLLSKKIISESWINPSRY